MLLLRHSTKIYLSLISILCLIILPFGLHAEKSLKLNLFEESTGARCLDGSKYGVYHSPGYEVGESNILINFWGGDLCTGYTHEQFFNDCLERSKGQLGSSNPWPKDYEYYSGFLSRNKFKNPNFYKWHIFDIPYCDGALHQGHVENPIPFKGVNFYFRGHKNILTALSFIEQKVDLLKINKVVLTGCSTGGYATFNYGNFISERFNQINPSLQVLGIPEAGFFADYYNYKTKDRKYFLTNKIFFDVINKEMPTVIPECRKEYETEPDKCLLTENFVKHVRIPLLFLQSGYDTSNILEDVGIPCVYNDSMDKCSEEEKLNANVYKIYQNELIKREINRKNNFSAFLISCVTHCFNDKKHSLDWAVPSGSENTINRVVERFIQEPNKRHVYIDEVEWPNNQNCAFNQNEWSKNKLEFLSENN